MHTDRRPHHRTMTALAAVLIVAAACGDDTATDAPASSAPPTPTPTPTATTEPQPDSGGFGAPAAAPGEFGDLPYYIHDPMSTKPLQAGQEYDLMYHAVDNDGWVSMSCMRKFEIRSADS